MALAPALPVDVDSALPWLALAGLIALAGIAGIAWQILGRLRAAEERLAALDRLTEIRAGIAKLGEARSGGAELRRLEHVLIDMRDGQRRLDERLMQLAEAAREPKAAGEGAPAPAAGGRAPYSERVVNRLLAMGYERIHILTPLEELAAVFEQGGEVLVEARHQGAICKGRVQVKDGAIAGAELRSAHSMFP